MMNLSSFTRFRLESNDVSIFNIFRLRVLSATELAHDFELFSNEWEELINRNRSLVQAFTSKTQSVLKRLAQGFSTTGGFTDTKKIGTLAEDVVDTTTYTPISTVFARLRQLYLDCYLSCPGASSGCSFREFLSIGIATSDLIGYYETSYFETKERLKTSIETCLSDSLRISELFKAIFLNRILQAWIDVCDDPSMTEFSPAEYHSTTYR
jgi:hypothetical protein